MAYIRKEQVAEKRNKIKKQFPKSEGWTFSVRKNDHSSTIICTILTAPLPLNEDEHINVYWIEKLKFKEVYSDLLNILNEGNHDNSDPMTDYYDVGWYVNLNIGSWEKPFKMIETTKTNI